MSIGKVILCINNVTVSYLIHYERLLQNATDIITKKSTAILLQNAAEVYYTMRQFFYYKMRQFYYKMRQLLQNAMFITNCDSTPVKFKIAAQVGWSVFLIYICWVI